MSTLVILFLLLSAGCLLIARYIKTGSAFFVTALLIFMLVGTGLLPTLLLENLESSYENQAQPHWGNQNAIILLGAGAVKKPQTNFVAPSIMAYSRIYEAARLYFACKKDRKVCTVFVSGGDAMKTGLSEALVYQKALFDLGVSEVDIELEPRSLNTFKNAEFTSALLENKNFNTMILVTSALHLKRSLLYFSHFGIHAVPAPADFIIVPMTVIPLGYNFAITDFALHEYIGILRFHFYNFMGWNAETAVAGAF